MGLMEWMQELGGKLRIIQFDSAGDCQPSIIKTKSVSLKQLASEVRGEELRALAELPAELSLDFEKVMETAGIKLPSHGWSVCKLWQLLDTPQYGSMDRVAIQRAILGLLESQKVSAEELIREAIGRDQALDAFEEFARKKMEVRDEVRARTVAQLQSQIKALQSQCEQLAQEKIQDREHWRAWHRRKTDYEKRLAHAMGYLLDKPIITEDTECE